jgi:hypothetical protein
MVHIASPIQRHRWFVPVFFLMLAVHVVGSELTCLTWNMCWFPSGKKDLWLPDVEPRRIAAAADIIRKESPHILFLQEIRDVKPAMRWLPPSAAKQKPSRVRRSWTTPKSSPFSSAPS